MDQRAQAGPDREIRTRRAEELLQAEQATLLEHRDSDLARSCHRVPKLFFDLIAANGRKLAVNQGVDPQRFGLVPPETRF